VAGVTEAHQLVAIAVIGMTVVLLVDAAWSWLTSRRSGGARDHRFAVDRSLLVLVGLIALNVLVGLALLADGRQPADPLHLLYAIAALVTLPGAWWWGGRTGRRRRDAWVAAFALVLLGIEARLFMTG
jgi:hypothetical protein